MAEREEKFEENRRKSQRSRSVDRRRDESREKRNRGREKNRESPPRDRKRDRSDSRPKRNRDFEKKSEDRSKLKEKFRDDEKERDRERDTRSKDRSRDRNRDRERSYDGKKGKERHEKDIDNKPERELKCARRSSSREKKPSRNRSRSGSRSRSRSSRSRSVSLSVSVAKSAEGRERRNFEKGDSAYPRRRKPHQESDTANINPVDSSGQFVVGPKRERWKPANSAADHPPTSTISSNSFGEKSFPTVRPPPPPLPPPKPIFHLPLNTDQKQVAPENEENYYSTLMKKWNDQLQSSDKRDRFDAEENINLTSSSSRWALELDNIAVLEKYAGKELYLKIAKFREQKSDQVINSKHELTPPRKSIEELLTQMTSAEAKEEESVIIQQESSTMETDERAQNIEVETTNMEVDDKPAPSPELQQDDDFDLYGDLSGEIVITADDEELNESEELATIQNKPSSSSKVEESNDALDDMYSGLFDDHAPKTDDKQEATQKQPESSSQLLSDGDFEEERKASYHYFRHQHPSIPWTELPYLTQDSSIQRMALLSKSTRNQTFSSIFLKDVQNIRKLFV